MTRPLVTAAGKEFVVELSHSERVAWRSVWRLLLALGALLLAGWSVGASDRNPWTPPAASSTRPSPELPLALTGGDSLSFDARVATSLPALWTPAGAGSAHPSPVDISTPLSTRAPGAPLPQVRARDSSGVRAAEFDGLSIVLAVLALLVLVSWRRRDQVVR